MSTNFMLILKECSISKTQRTTFTPTPSKTKSSSLNSIKIWSQPKIIFITKSDLNNKLAHGPINKLARSKLSLNNLIIIRLLLNFGDSETLLTVQFLLSFSTESFTVHSLKMSICFKVITKNNYWSFLLVSFPYLILASFVSMIWDSFGIHFWKLSHKSQGKV